MSHAPDFFVAVRNPKWADEAKTRINCEVNFKHVQFEEWTPFTANPDDVMPYSKDIFDRAVAGEFGDVAEPDVIPLIDQTPLTVEEVEALHRSLGITPRGPGQIGGVIL